ncbi:hypothetical protein BT96DRAFT_1017416 [Gymnopus androsaceus JB14]|uniref:Uncharacterized protein n=1 Tax=Gymnopus androsaceus JB14 TaxID=1447944 RepID=A0A6A4I1H6_9AGAR|nr:hypothetical protein BT96DRAFT_1017416 [Gymnopus androsaceus JB14]
MLILLWDLALISPFFSGLFKQSHFYASVLVLSEVLSAISLALLAVSWWKKSNEIGHSSAHKIASLERESRIFGAIDGLKLDHQRSSDSTPLPLDYPENDVERLEGLEEIDSNPNPFSDEYQARSSDSSLPPERVAEEIVESSVTELANPFLASSLDPRPSLTLAEERPDSLVLRGSFLSEGISDLADYETLPHEHSSPESPPVRPGLEDHRPASAVEVSEPPTPQDENEGWTGTVRMRHDTLESNATYATLPSYRSRASAGDLLESEPPQIPPLPSFRPLPSAPSPGFDVGISRQLSASTTRSYETVPSYRSS